MQAGFFCNLLGTGLVIIALIIHIVCLVTPHYAEADFTNVDDTLKDKGLSPTELEIFQGMAATGLKSHWGLWQFCFEGNDQIKMSSCKAWGEKEGEGTLDPGLWLKAARSLSILGAALLAKCAIGTVLTLIVESRGDRQKYLPFIICGFSFAAGFFTFVGDMVVAANYRSIENMGYDSYMSDKGKDVIGNAFSLGWSFGLDMVVPILACVCGICHLLGRRCYGTGSDITSSRLI